MTETEQLKRNTEMELMKQKLQEISEYLGVLMAEQDEAYEAYRRSMKLELTTVILMILISVFTDFHIIWIASYFLWLIVFVRDAVHVRPRLNKVMGELDGAFKILQIIGMIPPDEIEGKRKKLKIKKVSLYERMWAKIKREKMEEAIV